jgi:hypothetical protein
MRQSRRTHRLKHIKVLAASGASVFVRWHIVQVKVRTRKTEEIRIRTDERTARVV